MTPAEGGSEGVGGLVGSCDWSLNDGGGLGESGCCIMRSGTKPGRDQTRGKDTDEDGATFGQR